MEDGPPETFLWTGFMLGVVGIFVGWDLREKMDWSVGSLEFETGLGKGSSCHPCSGMAGAGLQPQNEGSPDTVPG